MIMSWVHIAATETKQELSHTTSAASAQRGIIMPVEDARCPYYVGSTRGCCRTVETFSGQLAQVSQMGYRFETEMGDTNAGKLDE